MAAGRCIAPRVHDQRDNGHHGHDAHRACRDKTELAVARPEFGVWHGDLLWSPRQTRIGFSSLSKIQRQSLKS
jgi:hypothetical protein